MTEAGRSAEPPLMAPPGRDAEQDGLIEDSVPSGLMSAPLRSASSRPDTDRPDTEGPKGNGKEKPDPDRESSAQPSDPSDSSGSSVSSAQVDVPFPADGISAPSQDGDRGGERFSATAAALNGKLDSGRHVVRQAMAATNNWIANRAVKSDSPTSAKDDADRPGESAASGTTDTSSGPATVMSPAGTVTASGETVAAGAASSAETVFGPAKSRPSSAPAASAVAASANGPDRRPGMGTGRSAAAQQPSYPPPRSSAAWSSTSVQPSRAAAPMPNRRPSAKLRRQAARQSRRQAHLTLARVEPWSVMKFSAMVSCVAFIILFVAIAVLYMALSGLGVFTSLQHTVSTITSSQGSSGTNISHWFSASRILGYTAMLGAANIVLITAMSTIGAVVYNLIAHTIGGIEVTLRETE